MNRYDTIIQLLKTNGYLNVGELCDKLKVSPATIRRDLTSLEQKSLLKRISGGAILVRTSVSRYDTPADPLIEEKKKIALQAVSYIEPGMTIFIDSGTTNNEIAKLFLDIHNIFVVTNSIHIAYLMYSNNKGSSVFVCGGNDGLNGGASIAGSMMDTVISHFRADLFFMGASSIDLDFGVTDRYIPFANIKKAMMRCSAKTVLVAEHSKYGTINKAFVSDIDAVDRIITGSDLPEKYVRGLGEKGVGLDLV